MRKSIIIVLQIICLLLMVTNHVLAVFFQYFPYIYVFGILVRNFLIDVIICVTIGLQIFIIVALIEDTGGEKKRC